MPDTSEQAAAVGTKTMAESLRPNPLTARKITALLVLGDGTVFEGYGLGAVGEKVGEVCFNTAMTGYQEVMTDPSYAGQIITFTFPHIGNVGTNGEDIEALGPPAALGCVLREDITAPSNFRSHQPLSQWLTDQGQVGICGIDTRALTRRIRLGGAPNGVIAHNPDGDFDLDDLKAKAAAWPGLEGMELAKTVTCQDEQSWSEKNWALGVGYPTLGEDDAKRHVVAIDFGVKRNILRCLADQGCKVTVVPAETSADDILALKPDGVFLSNGPGDPAATSDYAAGTIKQILDADKALFGICLGHQVLALAVGAKTAKMHQGHRGANHPVKDLTTGKVEITSMNHGFTVDRDSLSGDIEETHISLFDGTNCGIALKNKPVFSVQYHPEASPGPHDAHYLFKRFIDQIDETK